MPILLSAFCLAASRSCASRWNSSWLVMIEAPSSATVLAAPGASISRSISAVSFCFLIYCCRIWFRPSSRTEAACASLAALVGRSPISGLLASSPGSVACWAAAWGILAAKSFLASAASVSYALSISACISLETGLSLVSLAMAS